MSNEQHAAQHAIFALRRPKKNILPEYMYREFPLYSERSTRLTRMDTVLMI